MDELLFEGRIGHLRVEDVLQFVAQSGWDAALEFESEDRADGSPRAVDLGVREGRLVGIGPRGTGLRLGDLAVARHVVARAELEASLAESLAQSPDAAKPIGRVLVENGWLDEASLEDLLYERHARVIWGLASWDRGHFRVRAAQTVARPIEVAPPIPLEALLLDRLQRVELARVAAEVGGGGPRGS
ncbi:MAG: DUF4388 domain-containing protein [Candidatus Eiseniibacteriota bacterium]